MFFHQKQFEQLIYLQDKRDSLTWLLEKLFLFVVVCHLITPKFRVLTYLYSPSSDHLSHYQHDRIGHTLSRAKKEAQFTLLVRAYTLRSSLSLSNFTVYVANMEREPAIEMEYYEKLFSGSFFLSFSLIYMDILCIVLPFFFFVSVEQVNHKKKKETEKKAFILELLSLFFSLFCVCCYYFHSYFKTTSLLPSFTRLVFIQHII